VNKFTGKPTPPETTDGNAATAERRRMGRVVHDDRGTASVEWRDAPDDYERPKLEIEDTRSGKRPTKVRNGLETLSVKTDDTFNPYDRSPDPGTGITHTLAGPAGGKGAKRDLKKLSAWLKMMRELEERKKNEDKED
jgi:hypothetical protein